MFRCRHCGAFNRVSPNRAGTPVCGKCKKDLETSGLPQEVDSEGYARAIASSPVPVLVDFWAPWCAPCKVAAPMLERLAEKNRGKLLVLKVNTDDHPRPARELGVQGFPTFSVFAGGREQGRQSGLPPEPALDAWVSKFVPLPN